MTTITVPTTVRTGAIFLSVNGVYETNLRAGVPIELDDSELEVLQHSNLANYYSVASEELTPPEGFAFVTQDAEIVTQGGDPVYVPEEE